MRPFFYRNGLSIAVLAMMLAAWTAQAITGHAAYNDELIRHGDASIGWTTYLTGGDFWSATFENWESEFLQMGVYVLLTVWLRQKGSAESRPMPGDEEAGDGPTSGKQGPRAPRHGRPLRWLYANSLSIAFLLLFVLCFCGHLIGSWHKALSDAAMHHEVAPTLSDYALDPSFWFESFQNWQSEFLAVFSLVVLSVFLRQKGSPQSKALDEPNSKTGS